MQNDNELTPSTDKLTPSTDKPMPVVGKPSPKKDIPMIPMEDWDIDDNPPDRKSVV